VTAGAAQRQPFSSVRVLDREPETGDGHRVRVEERRVLVTADLAADVGLLEDVHALQRDGVRRGRCRRNAREVGRVAERLERRVEIVHRVPDLVDAELLRLAQGAVVRERLLLEEAPDATAARQEVVVADPLLFARGEHRAPLVRLELVDDGVRRVAQPRAPRPVDEPLDLEEPVPQVALDLRIAQHRTHTPEDTSCPARL
jgi:hypothetical protein